MRTLVNSRLAYACARTRKEIQSAASAPHADDGELRFPPELRPTDPAVFQFNRNEANYRLVVESGTIGVHDEFAGPRAFNPYDEVGDFLLWTKLGVPAYQLAVVVDDARQGVTDVVRGDDLLPSAARQVLLYRALGLPAPRWWHLPLVYGADGRRLAKRQTGTHLQTYREAGVRSERVIGLLAYWCNAVDHRVEMTAHDFLQAFCIHRLSACPVRFTEEDHQWLVRGC